jgi:hypothetical protein
MRCDELLQLAHDVSLLVSALGSHRPKAVAGSHRKVHARVIARWALATCPFAIGVPCPISSLVR